MVLTLTGGSERQPSAGTPADSRRCAGRHSDSGELHRGGRRVSQSSTCPRADTEAVVDRPAIIVTASAIRPAADAAGGVLEDSVGGANGVVLGAGGSFTGGQLKLPGGASATQAYGDLPNGLLSSLTDATLEAWVTIDGSQNWGRIFDFGSSDVGGGVGGEVTGPGGGGEGRDYLALTASRGDRYQHAAIGISQRGSGGRRHHDTGRQHGDHRRVRQCTWPWSTTRTAASLASRSCDTIATACWTAKATTAIELVRVERRQQLARTIELDSRRQPGGNVRRVSHLRPSVVARTKCWATSAPVRMW